VSANRVRRSRRSGSRLADIERTCE
jgi:hypothetical protein